MPNQRSPNPSLAYAGPIDRSGAEDLPFYPTPLTCLTPVHSTERIISNPSNNISFFLEPIPVAPVVPKRMNMPRPTPFLFQAKPRPMCSLASAQKTGFAKRTHFSRSLKKTQVVLCLRATHFSRRRPGAIEGARSSLKSSKGIIVNSITRQAVGFIAVIAITMVGWRMLHTPQNPLVPDTKAASTTNIGDFDQFQRDLATRVMNQLGGSGGNDFSVIVATFAYPLGTLLSATRSIPASLDDCTPTSPPPPFGAPRLFPSYTMSSKTAITANIGGGVIEGLANAGINLGQSQNLEYSVAETQIQVMDDKSVEQVMKQGACGNYIARNPGVRLIRGVVTGRMTFTVKVDNPASAKAQLARIGFSVTDNPQSSTLSVADKQSQPIVQLLSEFRPDPNVTAKAAKPQAIQRTMTKAAPPAPGKSGPHMFVQMDELDKRSSGDKVVQLLRAQWPSANVESQVEKIRTRNMPKTAQIRYSNESDAAIAKRCVEILSSIYPNVQAVRIGIPSPTGQLEVWLPRVSGA